jgi:hypothetical protein
MSTLRLILWNQAPTWTMVVVGLVVLLWYRHRSHRAVALGVVALCGYVVWGLLNGFASDIVVWWAGPEKDVDRAIEATRALVLASFSWHAVCTLVLIAAVLTDRKPAEANEAES